VIGGVFDQLNRIKRPHGALPGPQRVLDLDQMRIVHDATLTPRAAILTRIPKRTATFFAPFKGPFRVQRIPPNLTYEDPNYRYLRDTLLARSRLVRNANATGQGSL
jgi:hypothetical protein